MKQFHKLLKFLNLTDRGGDLSITNIAVIVIITKMALAPFDWVTAAGLMISLLNYAHKRSETNKSVKEAKIIEDANQTKSELEALKEEVAQVKSLHDVVAKQADDTRKALNNANITAAFGVRKS